MSCCGGGRRSTGPVVGSSTPSRTPAPTARPTLAVFRYEGNVPITVVGPVTGAKYRFESLGAELAVDMRDRYAVRKVPRLRELRLV